MGQVEINGLLWDTENIEIEGKKYFTWQEAMDAAKSVGKRLPTDEEFKSMIATGYEYNHAKEGMWFADKKLFFPLSGCLHYTSGDLLRTEHGFLWSSSPKDSSSSWHLGFTDGAAYMYTIYTTYGFPVRCVQDISDNSTIKEESSHPSKNIDWEQRRYEVAKDFFCYNSVKIEDAIKLANEFIKQFKENETI